MFADDSLASIGGDDKIYGTDGLIAPVVISAGPANDLISLGSNGSNNVVARGDNFTTTPLIEDATGLNIADGDDIIQMGNNHNGLVKLYGQGGNDKLIGGYNNTPAE